MVKNALPYIAPSGLHVSIVDDQLGLDALQESWNELFAISPSAAPPLRWNWVAQWWRMYGPVYGHGGDGLRILTLRRGTRLVGILPLYEGYKNSAGIKIPRLTFISAGAAEFEETCAEYLDLLYAPGEEMACIAAIAQALRTSERLRWHELWLPDMSQSSHLADIAGILGTRGCRAGIATCSPCFLIDMRRGFQQYLKDRSAKARKNANRAMRDACKANHTFEIAGNAQQADLFFEQMVELHRKRWNARDMTGSFAPRHAQFHRAMVCQGAASGDTVIARLTAHDVPIALVYGHRVGEQFHAYQQGVDTTDKHDVQSPGTATWFMLMQRLTQQGVGVFDFLKGSNRFKTEFCTGQNELVDVRVSKMTFRTVSGAIAHFSQRAARKLFGSAGNRKASDQNGSAIVLQDDPMKSGVAPLRAAETHAVAG